MPVGLIGTLLVGLLLVAAPVAAQHDPGPPHAGTQVRCCTAWTVSVVHRWELPGGLTQKDHLYPPEWAMVSIVVTPEGPNGNAYGYTVPGTAVRMFVWDPTVARAMGGWLSPLMAIAVSRFPVVYQNALGGQFRGGGIAEVYHANHLPDVVKVYVVMADGTRSRAMTARVR